mmetsp:Transcript_22205/g.33913  ORF Transcript_22205/g.33913 Transcript_22205/m.33913 type:complete len:344 (-) Transcript_22205:53-1084(-)|eukprot:CAMPEP_0196808706 /NCGR_PEP_ID=MMETSP1362-20130617/8697_1 /TAXON_ID=163516 /ORGANISM="Leptocylindrus danicus, Strain CCMP1856" /LENGTH=343 /DNA_ID=CAMNT_0042183129 /DNA_START=58 /DNA_END=1089 /DNA_ORIENTATION=+
MQRHLLLLILLSGGVHSLTSSNGANIKKNMIQQQRDAFTTVDNNAPITPIVGRRSFVKSGTKATAALVGALIAASSPRTSSAAIDVSGLGGASSSSSLADQLKAYDGSGSARVREIKSSSSSSSSPSSTATTASSSIIDDVPENVATNVFVAGADARLTKVGLTKLTTRYDGQLLAPNKSNSRYLSVSFEFPTDWLQLDKFNGGIQYVDQRNGDKLYVLRATLPQDTTLSTVPNTWFGNSIFDPKGAIAKSGNTVEEYKVASAKMLEDCGSTSLCYNRRRLKIKYSTITGNNLQVERRALVDAYEVDGDVYMLMTSSNANKFEAQGVERDTVEAIVSSFRIDR